MCDAYMHMAQWEKAAEAQRDGQSGKGYSEVIIRIAEIEVVHKRR